MKPRLVKIVTAAQKLSDMSITRQPLDQQGIESTLIDPAMVMGVAPGCWCKVADDNAAIFLMSDGRRIESAIKMRLAEGVLEGRIDGANMNAHVGPFANPKDPDEIRIPE